MQEKEIWIVAAKRTPMGRFQGMLSEYSSPKLGAVAIKAAMEEQSLSPELVDEVYMAVCCPQAVGKRRLDKLPWELTSRKR